MNETIKNILHKIGTGDSLILKIVKAMLAWPIKFTQLQLLKVQKDTNTFLLVKKIQKEKHTLLFPLEMAQVYHCATAVKRLPGDFAEVGVYMGRSAKLISEIKGNKTLHLFDTFEGLPKPESKDDGVLYQQQYSAKLDSVKKYLASYKDVNFYQGLFPDTARPVMDKTFAFVHLDVDLYRSTKDALEFFYPRMTVGGIILSHDYSSLIGVKRAFDDFFTDKTESVIELSNNQCLVVKR